MFSISSSGIIATNFELQASTKRDCFASPWPKAGNSAALFWPNLMSRECHGVVAEGTCFSGLAFWRLAIETKAHKPEVSDLKSFTEKQQLPIFTEKPHANSVQREQCARLDGAALGALRHFIALQNTPGSDQPPGIREKIVSERAQSDVSTKPSEPVQQEAHDKDQPATSKTEKRVTSAHGRQQKQHPGSRMGTRSSNSSFDSDSRTLIRAVEASCHPPGVQSAQLKRASPLNKHPAVHRTPPRGPTHSSHCNRPQRQAARQNKFCSVQKPATQQSQQSIKQSALPSAPAMSKAAERPALPEGLLQVLKPGAVVVAQPEDSLFEFEGEAPSTLRIGRLSAAVSPRSESSASQDSSGEAHWLHRSHFTSQRHGQLLHNCGSRRTVTANPRVYSQVDSDSDDVPLTAHN